MDPFLTPLLISGAMAGISAGAKAIPTAADRRNKKMLDELLALEEQNKLGLTGQERNVAEQRSDAALAQQAAQQKALADRAIQAQLGQGAGVGQVLRAGQIMADQGATARQRAISDLEALDLEKKQVQLQEIENRTQAKAMQDKAARQALIGGAEEIAGAGLAAVSQRNTTQGPPAAQALRKAAQMNLDEDQLALFEDALNDPLILELLMKQ